LTSIDFPYHHAIGRSPPDGVAVRKFYRGRAFLVLLTINLFPNGNPRKIRPCNKILLISINYYLLVCTTCTPGTTVSRLACFASFASIYRPVLTFWQSDRKCRLKGNLSGPMKTGVSPGGPRSMAVSYDYISGCVHVACTCTVGILDRPVLAGADTTVLLIVY